jgi:hypothetical protein
VAIGNVVYFSLVTERIPSNEFDLRFKFKKLARLPHEDKHEAKQILKPLQCGLPLCKAHSKVCKATSSS